MSDETYTTILNARVPTALIDRYINRIMQTVREKTMTTPEPTPRDEGLEDIVQDYRHERAHAAPDEATVERAKRNVYAELGCVRDEETGEVVAFEQFMRDGHSILTDEDTYTLTHETLDRFVRAALAGFAALPAPPSLEAIPGLRGVWLDRGLDTAEPDRWSAELWVGENGARVFGDGPTIEDAVRAAIAAAQEGA